MDLATNPVAIAQAKCATAGALATQGSGTLIGLMMMPKLLQQHRPDLLRLHAALDEARQAVADVLDIVELG